MYHEDGIAVRLEARGNDIKEWTYRSGQDPADPEHNDTRAIISAKFNTHFTVVLEVTEDFRRFSTEGLKLIVAIGHNQQIPGDLDDVQAWHIPLNAYFKNRFKISKQWSWGGGSYETLIEELVIPAPKVAQIIPAFYPHMLTSIVAYEFDAVPNNGWVTTRNAAKGCITIYVLRGKLTGATDFERNTFATDPPDDLRYSSQSQPCQHARRMADLF
jgi:hypothetical protein